MIYVMLHSKEVQVVLENVVKTTDMYWYVCHFNTRGNNYESSTLGIAQSKNSGRVFWKKY